MNDENNCPFVNLTTYGDVEWAHYGVEKQHSDVVERSLLRAGVDRRIIGDLSTTGGVANTYANNPTVFGWSDGGSPSHSANASITGVFLKSGGDHDAMQGSVFMELVLSLPPPTSTDNDKNGDLFVCLYVGVYDAAARLTVSVAPKGNDTSNIVYDFPLPDQSYTNVQLKLKIPAAAATVPFTSSRRSVTIKWTLMSGKNVQLQAIAISRRCLLYTSPSPRD